MIKSTSLGLHNNKDLLHDKVHVLGFDKDGDGVDPGRLEPLDGVAGHVQDTMLAFLSHSLQYISPISCQIKELCSEELTVCTCSAASRGIILEEALPFLLSSKLAPTPSHKLTQPVNVSFLTSQLVFLLCAWQIKPAYFS
jgi:hypothetical protein